ncbi:MAG: 2Fe-2S iron-sulfur cluster binding domain-containing protein [Alphaproteobacteria bacterium]|nr:2Fe-2S iron-sulfur cluster binding domain-containing protein [Alphaproteobacteria bacterium]
MNIVIKMPDGETREIEATIGWQVMEIIKNAGVPIRAECGGACACATCHVYVDAAWMDRLPPRKDEETDMLDMALSVEDNSRLSCQIVFEPELDGLTVTLAEDSL